MPATLIEYNKQDMWDEAKLIAEFRYNLESVLGFTFVDQVALNAQTTYVTWSKQIATGVTKDTVFLRLTLTNQGATRTDIQVGICDGYVAGSNDWKNIYLWAGMDLSGIKGQVQNLFWYTISHAEWQTVSMRFPGQGGRWMHLGFVRPASKPAYWNENQFLYAFLPYFYGRNFASCGSNPFTNASDGSCIAVTPNFYSETMGGDRFVGANSQGRKTVLYPLPLAGYHDLFGTFSNDFGIISNNSDEYAAFSRFQPSGSEEWIMPGQYRIMNVIRVA